jgi:hypothetical protein
MYDLLSAMSSRGVNAFATKSGRTEYKYNTNRHVILIRNKTANKIIAIQQTPFLMHLDFHYVVIKLFIKK